MSNRPETPTFRIVKSPQLLEHERNAGKPAADDRQRDQRPGRFTIRGSFIELPGGAAASSPVVK